MTKTLDYSEGSTPIPGPAGYPLIGNLLDIDMSQCFVSLNALHKKYGPVYQISFLGQTIIMVSSPDVVHVLSDEDKFHKHIDPTLLAVRGFAGDGLFTALHGEKSWDIAHRILVPAFGAISVRKMQEKMLDPLGQMLMWWECHAGEPFEAADQFTRLTFMFYAATSRQWDTDIALLNKVCDEIISERRNDPMPDEHDVLDRMLFGKDAKTGEGLSDENIRYQMITFLIAGHETTSGLLAFATYYMLKTPGVIAKMRSEVEQALADVGGAFAELAVGKLRYVDAVLRETLRLHPSAPFFIRTPNSEQGARLPGGYHVKHGQAVAISLHALHRDPEVFEAPEEFRPERWLDGTTYPPDAYKPFGTGGRACIGRMFAMQEAALAMALIVDRFDLSLADENYELQIQESLTIKPVNFNIKVAPRKKTGLLRELMTRSTVAKEEEAWKPVSAKGKMHVLFGSNNGACEALAGDLAAEYRQSGFSVTLDSLDDAAPDGKLPTDGTIVLILPSYDGQPAENARDFVASIANMEPGSLSGVEYTVFGVGHRDWAATLHRIPKLVDSRLSELGAERLLPISLGDAAVDLLSDFEDFSARLRDHLEIDVTDISAWSIPDSANCAPVTGFTLGRVMKQTKLTDGVMSIAIQADQPWQVGDYLAILPKNPASEVERALRVLGLKGDDHIRSPMAPGPLRAWDVLESYLELGTIIPKRYLTILPKWALSSASRLAAMADDYATVRLQRLSLIDVLERFPDVRPPLGHVLYALPRIRARQYSIASTPPGLELTYSVHERGVASRYLASLSEGDAVLCATRRSTFHPPPAQNTLVMFAAGTGIAPFRGFIAERAERARLGEKTGGTVLYYGARDAAHVLHDVELRHWVRNGVLELRPTLSRAERPKYKLVEGCRYVQDRMWAERTDISAWLEGGAAFYTCGGTEFASGVRKCFTRIIAEKEGAEKAEDEMAKLGERFKQDVFTS
ncbi:cytochrome P450 [Trichosporon asahii var. asahii CBS 8904]|uniref:Cytochrome P450 n=1 Tax=Trichosporon asahii var. asahii (strain CBS 8904) TaxID=1220162 RepID=K1V6A3_TRIAC|nr:cytochrome P450 [Trichosporon asahii var. asahii CBS 8904]